eukprot:9480933-Pyramimonas_sp.AAC.1
MYHLISCCSPCVTPHARKRASSRVSCVPSLALPKRPNRARLTTRCLYPRRTNVAWQNDNTLINPDTLFQQPSDPGSNDSGIAEFPSNLVQNPTDSALPTPDAATPDAGMA